MEEGFYGPALWSHPADTPAPKAGVNTSTTGDRQINHSQPGCVMGKSLWCLLRTHPERQSCCQSVLHPHVPRALGSFFSLEPPHHSPAKLIFSIHLSSMYTQRREGICCVLAALFEMILKIKVVLVQPVLGFLHSQCLPGNLLSGISCLTVWSSLSLLFRLMDVLLVVACGSSSASSAFISIFEQRNESE